MKPVFQAWDERALFQYVHHGFRENSQGEVRGILHFKAKVHNSF